MRKHVWVVPYSPSFSSVGSFPSYYFFLSVSLKEDGKYPSKTKEIYSSFTFCYFLFYQYRKLSLTTFQKRSVATYLLILIHLATIYQEKPVNLPNASFCIMEDYFQNELMRLICSRWNLMCYFGHRLHHLSKLYCRLSTLQVGMFCIKFLAKVTCCEIHIKSYWNKHNPLEWRQAL